MSRLEFKPQDRQSIDFAEEERKKSVGDSGKIIHEEDINNSGKCAISGSVRKSSQWTISAGTSETIYSTTINKKYDKTKLFVQGLCNVWESTNGMGGCLIIHIDGGEVARHLINSATFTTLYPSVIKNGISKGSHTVSFVLACDSGTLKVPAYQDSKFVIFEL